MGWGRALWGRVGPGIVQHGMVCDVGWGVKAWLGWVSRKESRSEKMDCCDAIGKRQQGVEQTWGATLT